MPFDFNMKFLKRLELAYKVFKLKEFDEDVSGYEYAGDVAGASCDDCPNPSRWCMSRLRIRFEVRYEDHFHCCDKCKKRVQGRLEFHKDIQK